MLEAAGFEQPARTLDELTEQAIKIKEARVKSPEGDVVEYPIMLGFRQVITGFTDWWALNYASEVDLFDDDINPIFPDDVDRRAERILQWITDGIHKHGIININSLTSPLILENVSAGRQAFAMINKHDLERVNSREDSAVAEAYLRARGITETQTSYAKVIKMAPVPSLEPDQQGTLGWSRMYSLTAHCREEYLLDAWRLVQFLGGRDAQAATIIQYGTGFDSEAWASHSGPYWTTPKSLSRQSSGETPTSSRNCQRSPVPAKTSGPHGFPTSTSTISRRSRKFLSVSYPPVMGWRELPNGAGT